MIITNCAACAAPLTHDAPRCVRCKTRYCDSTCQHDHWRRGHKQISKKIHRGGNAEQYHADNKYKEAVAVAVEKCGADSVVKTSITYKMIAIVRTTVPAVVPSHTVQDSTPKIRHKTNPQMAPRVSFYSSLLWTATLPC